MMKSIAALAVLAVLAPGDTIRAHAAPVEAMSAGAVKVTVNYTGSGKVDGGHRVWVWLFDTPDIGPGAMPIGEISVVKNGEAAVFEVSSDRVWVAYDERGVMLGNAPPAPGSPIGIYSSSTGAPEPVSPGAKGAVTVTFDDSQRMP